MKIYMVRVNDRILEMVFDDYLSKHKTNVLPLEEIRGENV